jgi:hypothetical protein
LSFSCGHSWRWTGNLDVHESLWESCYLRMTEGTVGIYPGEIPGALWLSSRVCGHVKGLLHWQRSWPRWPVGSLPTPRFCLVLLGQRETHFSNMSSKLLWVAFGAAG